MTTDDFLLATGMTQEEINAFDSDIKEYIVSNLKDKANTDELEYVELEVMPSPRVSQTLTGISFTAYAFKSGSTIYIYPTYEFTDAKRPRGQDSFSYQLGDAMLPYNYGGTTWYFDDIINQWTGSTSMTANMQGFNGAEYSGDQLGTPTYAMRIKGCAYCHASIGTGTDKRIIMSYLYNPNKSNYSISFGIGTLGISYSSSGTVYTAAKTIVLAY